MPEIIDRICAPEGAFDESFTALIKDQIDQFDLSQALLPQIQKLVEGFLSEIATQWGDSGLNVYPMTPWDDLHPAFVCSWEVLDDEIYTFMSGHVALNAYDKDAIKQLAKLRDRFRHMADIVERDMAAGRPSEETIKRY